ncbi:hypothetical protein LSCM1_04399 [Leishmania martiniquensis]|uniref:Uncharacterized protein n=1 Tax=Leishmania martiniquensis TaxID=1580590 RepID=A0A836GK40_9TRYP|nr:hypothetical protein LSCM1_04399 [Leishmania martiniquensis]
MRGFVSPPHWLCRHCLLFAQRTDGAFCDVTLRFHDSPLRFSRPLFFLQSYALPLSACAPCGCTLDATHTHTHFNICPLPTTHSPGFPLNIAHSRERTRSRAHQLGLLNSRFGVEVSPHLPPSFFFSALSSSSSAGAPPHKPRTTSPCKRLSGGRRPFSQYLHTSSGSVLNWLASPGSLIIEPPPQTHTHADCVRMATEEYSKLVSEQRLSPAAEEDLVQRLYYRQMKLLAQREEERRVTLERTRAQMQKHISKEEENHLVSRMYDQQLERLANSRAERDRRVEEEVHKRDRKMDPSEIDDQVRRMYEEERKKSRARREELNSRYMPTAEPKKIGKKELQASVERLSHVDWEKRDEELFKKYVYPYDPKTTTISRDDEQAMADRLSTTKGTG